MYFGRGNVLIGMSRAKTLPNPENCSIEDLDIARKCAANQAAFARMTAIRALLLGFEFSATAVVFNVSQRTLSRWVKAFNEEGIDGLLDDPRPGRPRAIAFDDNERLRQLVEQPALAGEVFWTARKFNGYLNSTLGREIGYSTVTRWLHEQNYKLLVPRAWPDRQDEQKRAAFLELLRHLLADDKVELWFGDECGFEGDPRPRRRWAQVGSKPTRVKNGDHIRSNFIGVISPRTGELAGIEVSGCNTETYQAFLDEANKDLRFEREANYLIVDNASWHKAKSLNWGKFIPLYLPPYSPDFNPIERLWLLVKNEWFSDFVARNRDQLSDRIFEAIQWALKKTEKVKSMCTIKTEL
jgi:transposase